MCVSSHKGVFVEFSKNDEMFFFVIKILRCDTFEIQLRFPSYCIQRCEDCDIPQSMLYVKELLFRLYVLPTF